mmetsp:Transcript_5667/g.9892  ORF Transcript_5667/g.9892 Transcript_5667/m.9892 type:complete len:227 (+) Transcript_5667:148-828(+)
MVSTRRRQHHYNKSQKYAVGDKVEVLRGDGLAVGYLLSKAKDDKGGKNTRKSSNINKDKKSGSDKIRWLVSVEGGSGDEEIIPEQSLGRVLEEKTIGSSDESATFEKTNTTKPVVVKKSVKAKTSVSKTKPSASKAVNVSPSSSSKKATGSNKSGAQSSRSSSSNSNNNNNPEEGIAEWQRKRPVPRPKKMEGDGKIIEVNLKTGTLFMYHGGGGKHRRVEYIQRV